MTPAIHALLLSLPPFAAEPTPETADERAVRLEPVAAAIAEASAGAPAGFSRGQWAAVLVALGKHESNFAKYVQEGKCSEGRPGERCDDGKAKSHFQLHYAACPAAWELEPGTVAELNAATKCASRLLASALRRCRSRNTDPLAGAFSGYAGASCVAPWANRRANTARVFAGRLGQ